MIEKKTFKEYLSTFSIIYDIFIVLKMCGFSHNVYYHVKRLKTPSEAPPAVSWQYFAVDFIVEGRAQISVLKDSTFRPRERLPLGRKGRTWPAPE